MATPYKIRHPAPINQNAEVQKRVVALEPAKDDRAINEECVDDVPDHTPRIAWPNPRPLEQPGAPFKLRK